MWAARIFPFDMSPAAELRRQASTRGNAVRQNEATACPLTIPTMMTIEIASSPDDGQIRAMLDARANAMRNKDIQGVLSGFADDAVGYFLDAPLEQSPLQQDLAEWFASWVGPIGYEMRGLTIESGGDVAYGHALSRITGARTDGEETDMWFRETFCLRRTNGRWLITHVHESVPLYMDGIVRAAFDLTPIDSNT